MGHFGTLRTMREFEREHLAFLDTVEDVDIVREIGFHQEAGKPLTLSELLALGISSAATLQRRLARLRKLGVVEQRRLAHDRRSFTLSLSPAVLKAYASYLSLLKKLLSNRRASG